ncbi:hypothetical protein [Fundidesulfovibrio soli]|uniref:hypothetical protein n=1 Tax=Fundidesulfovibrio soli TaxID=2922716 RepID=UPI001FAEE34F|nr:hypothetical protein [Fundidesulfovibrio soli]
MEEIQETVVKKTCLDCDTEDCPARASGFRCPEKEIDPNLIAALEHMFNQKFKTKIINGEYLNEEPRL